VPAIFSSRPQQQSRALVLAIIVVVQLMIVLDASIVITALPKIHHALGFSEAGLSWVQNAYTLTFGGLLLLGARAGDILGRRRVFIGGIALFSVASLLGGLAQSADWLLVARAVQGVGAAIAAPSALALLTTSFTEGEERSRALAFYAAASAAGGSLGLVLGGMLTDWVSWRWGLFINVPIGLAVIALAPRFLPETKRTPGRFDALGALTSTLGMSLLVYGFVRAAADGWSDSQAVVAFAASAALLAGFVRTELTAEQPITPMRLFSHRERAGAYVARIFFVGGFFGMFFYMSQFLQGVLGYSPLEGGLAFLPTTVVIFSLAQVLPRLIVRFGNARLLALGVLLAFVGMAWLSRVSVDSTYLADVALPLLLVGTGAGLAFGPLTAAGLTGVEPRDAGAASGLVNAAHQLGGSVGLGILVTVFAAATPHATTASSLAHGVSTSVTGSAVFLGLALLIVLATMVRRPVAPVLATEPEPEEVAVVVALSEAA
jgi:EmrB/QacA subfamily drug resistance transporter